MDKAERQIEESFEEAFDQEFEADGTAFDQAAAEISVPVIRNTW